MSWSKQSEDEMSRHSTCWWAAAYLTPATSVSTLISSRAVASVEKVAIEGMIRKTFYYCGLCYLNCTVMRDGQRHFTRVKDCVRWASRAWQRVRVCLGRAPTQ